MFEEIKGYNTWKTTEKLSKGWSSDSKYIIETKTGETLLLRVSDIEHYEAKKKEYEIIQKYAELGFLMSMPLDFGVCNHGENAYMLLTWVEGIDLEEALPNLPQNEQYRLGREAGKILKKIHSLEVDANDLPKDTKKGKKLLQLSRYEESQVRIDNDETAIEYVKQNIDKIWSKSPVYQHGDYHPGNLIYTKDGSIGVIDFNRWEVGDPYEEFYKLESFGIESSIPYCVGQIEAYFDDHIPGDFWVTLAVYVAHAALYSIKWAEKFGQKDIDGMKERCRRAFANYDEFRSCIPRWFVEHTKENLLADLSAMGLKHTDAIMVHSSMKSIGAVAGGADTVVDAFMEYFKEGLFMTPTHTWAQMGENHSLFDPEEEPACVGIIPNVFRQREGVVRSLHPTHSIAAYGPKAAAYIKGEENVITPAQPGGCWSRLLDVDAKILLVGCTHARNTFMHAVEEHLDVPERLTAEPVNFQIKMPDGSIKDVAVHRHYNPVTAHISEEYDKLAQAFYDCGAAKKVKFGDADCILCEAREIYRVMEKVLAHEINCLIDRSEIPREWWE